MMKIRLDMREVSAEVSRLIARAAVASGIDPLQLRAVAADSESITAMTGPLRCRVTALLRNHISGMGCGTSVWNITLRETPWMRHADRNAIGDSLLRMTALTAAAQLLEAGPLASAGTVYRALAAEEGAALADLLDTLATVPPPGRVRLSIK